MVTISFSKSFVFSFPFTLKLQIPSNGTKFSKSFVFVFNVSGLVRPLGLAVTSFSNLSGVVCTGPKLPLNDVSVHFW